jgi:hypothetical protein
MFENQILTKQQANLLWSTSWFCFVSSLYAFSQSHYGLAVLPGGCFITSINYWRSPDYSWRRYVDIVVVNYSIVYQTYYAYYHKAENFQTSFLFMQTGAFCFLLGVYFYEKKQYWLSTYCHALLHFFANIANIILYSGKISYV